MKPNAEAPTNRLRELDFLRGIAILLVLVRHVKLNAYTTNMGWIGVDLFFVLSGFLVSGLLFKEYIKYGNIDARLFLIRRGFKIYPVYYLAITAYTLPLILSGKFYLRGFISELIFLQNYATGFGWSFLGSWSLAVEEHFYFGLVFVLLFLTGKKWLSGRADENGNRVEKILISIMAVCLTLRIVSNLLLPINRNFTMTHLRIDSLLAGVLISYLYYFKRPALTGFFGRHKKMFVVFSILLLSFSPFIEDPFRSFFVKTVGFTLLYLSFGLLLVCFLLVEDINKKLNRVLSRPVVSLVSHIGIYSYSIYLMHAFVIDSLKAIDFESENLRLLISFFLSILAGMAVSISLESFFLRLRDRYFPSRVSELSMPGPTAMAVDPK